MFKSNVQLSKLGRSSTVHNPYFNIVTNLAAHPNSRLRFSFFLSTSFSPPPSFFTPLTFSKSFLGQAGNFQYRLRPFAAKAKIPPLLPIMPPKQATLGYVKSGQQTLGCMLPVNRQSAHSLMRICPVRKFFGRPTGSSPKPQQSKLAFQRPHTTKAAQGKSEEADTLNKDVAGDEDLKMDSDSEVHKSAMDTKQADPATNGVDKVNHSNDEGKTFNSDFQLNPNY